MNNDPIHINTYDLEGEQIDQIIRNSIWVTTTATGPCGLHLVKDFSYMAC